MNETKPSGAYKALGIVGLVLASLAFVFAFVPCLGMYAIYPGVAALILGVTSLAMAAKVGGAKTVGIIAVCLAVAGTGVATWQYMAMKKGIEAMDKAFKDIKIDTTTSNGMSASESETQAAFDSVNNAATPTEAASH